MKITLNVQKLIQWCVNNPSEFASSCVVKTLQCIAKYGDNPIEVTDCNSVGSVLIEEFDIWFTLDEYTVVAPPPEVLVTITGNSAVGKTAVMEFMAQMCQSAGLQVQVDYGTDGNPRRSQTQRYDAIENIKSRGTVVYFVEKYGNSRNSIRG